MHPPGVPGGPDLWRWYKTADSGPNADGTLPCKYEGQPDCGMFVTPFCSSSGFAPGGGDGDVAVSSRTPRTRTHLNLAVVSLSAAKLQAATPPTVRMRSVLRSSGHRRRFPRRSHRGSMASTILRTCTWSTTILGRPPKSSCNARRTEARTYTDALGAVVDAATEQANRPPPTSCNIAGGQIRVDNSSCSSHGNLYADLCGPRINPVDNSHNSAALYECRLRGRGHGR